MAYLVFASSTVLLPSVAYNVTSSSDDTVVRTQMAVDVVLSVLITFICTLILQMHKTVTGILRTLWLVTVVSASSSFTFFQKLTKNDALPNDINLIAVLVTSAVFSLLFLISKCRREYPRNNSVAAMSSELCLVAGAIILRFDESFVDLSSVHIGVLGWRLFSSAAGVFATATV